MSEKDDMAQALRELLNNWRNRYGVYVNGRPSLTTDNCIHDIKSLLATHEPRAQPASVAVEELRSAVRAAIDDLAEIGYPVDDHGNYDKNGKWTFADAIPTPIDAASALRAFNRLRDAMLAAAPQPPANGEPLNNPQQLERP